MNPNLLDPEIIKLENLINNLKNDNINFSFPELEGSFVKFDVVEESPPSTPDNPVTQSINELIKKLKNEGYVVIKERDPSNQKKFYILIKGKFDESGNWHPARSEVVVGSDVNLLDKFLEENNKNISFAGEETEQDNEGNTFIYRTYNLPLSLPENNIKELLEQLKLKGYNIERWRYHLRIKGYINKDNNLWTPEISTSTDLGKLINFIKENKDENIHFYLPEFTWANRVNFRVVEKSKPNDPTDPIKRRLDNLIIKLVNAGYNVEKWRPEGNSPDYTLVVNGFYDKGEWHPYLKKTQTHYYFY